MSFINISNLTIDKMQLADNCIYPTSKSNYRVSFKCLREQGLEILADKLYHSSIFILVWVFIATPLIRYVCLKILTNKENKLSEIEKRSYKTVANYIYLTDYVALGSFCFFVVFLRHFGG